ncbi:MAG: 50S ribosomal protein L15 [Thermoleophilia bacterium]|jgi:large subunit ribosomal protein L15|nr:50S ribosomal protein L15 [Thermoleophilia bacterium]
MPDDAVQAVDPEEVRLESLAPLPGSRRPRKRIGRGIGSGTGKTSGRGHKGAGARSGPGPIRGYIGGAIPVHMQKGKLRGSNHKKSMPIGPFRTHTVPVNLSELARVFEPGDVVDIAALEARGLVKNNANRGWPVKILAKGEIDRPLTVRAHAFSAAAKAKIEAAGGTAEIVGAPQGDGQE